MPCCPPESTKTNGAPGICHRRARCAAPFHWLVEIWRWLAYVVVSHYSTTKTSPSSNRKKHPPYRHEIARKEADTWLSGPLPPRRSCGDEDVQRQRIWRKTSRTPRRPKVQALDAAPFATAKVSGRVDSSRIFRRYAFQHSRNAGAKSSGLAD